MTESKSPEELQKDLVKFKEWVAEQPHLPSDLSDRLLRRFLHSCYYDMERAQRALETFTSLRATSPELFNNRDPLSPQIQKALKIVTFASLRASGNRSLWIKQLIDPGLEHFDYLQDARLFLLTSDALLMEDDHLAESEVVIMDVKDVTFKIFTKINMSVAKKLGKYQEEAIPIRLKQIHIVNAPPFIDKLFSLMKHFMKQDTTDLIHFHVPNSDTLYDFISRDELPKEFGGNLGSMKEYTEKSLEVLYKHREALCNDNMWKALEKKSKKKTKPSALPPPVPQRAQDLSFRSLDID